MSTVAGNLDHAKWSVPSWRVAVIALNLCYARTAGGSAAPAQPPARDGLFDGVFGAESPAVVAAGGAARRGDPLAAAGAASDPWDTPGNEDRAAEAAAGGPPSRRCAFARTARFRPQNQLLNPTANPITQV